MNKVSFEEEKMLPKVNHNRNNKSLIYKTFGLLGLKNRSEVNIIMLIISFILLTISFIVLDNQFGEDDGGYERIDRSDWEFNGEYIINPNE